VTAVKPFFVDALSSALQLGIATPDDLLRHVTPDVLATHLPRPLWARLLTACLGAPRVDAQLVVETVGVGNLCEHVPSPIIWNVIAEVAARSLGNAIPIAPAPSPILKTSDSEPVRKPLSIGSPPPPAERPMAPERPASVGPSIPPPSPSGNHAVPVAIGLEDVVAELEAETPSPPARSRTATGSGNRFRQTNTNIGRLAAANQSRRPQASVGTPPAPSPSIDPDTQRPGAKTSRRGETDIEVEMETDVSKDDWRTALAVEDEQLVDWSTSEETQTTTEGEQRKR
jgi:hypothetical protein